MRLITHSQMCDWLSLQPWLSLPDDRLHLTPVPGHNLTTYEFTIAEDSAMVGAEMARLLFSDFDAATFPGGLFWIARTFGSSDEYDASFVLLNQILYAGGIVRSESWSGNNAVLLDPEDFDGAVGLIAISLMFGWDTSLAMSGRRFLITTDDEPFPAVTTDQLGPRLASTVAEPHYEVRISPV